MKHALPLTLCALILAACSSGYRAPTATQLHGQRGALRPGGKNLKIGGSLGQPVNAAADGEVAYVGSGLTGLGRAVVIRHGNVFAAYAYLDNIRVKEKQHVQRGQQIASMGIGPQNTPALYFETRQGSQTANPYSYIGTTPRY